MLQTTPWKAPVGMSTRHFQDMGSPRFLNDVPGQIMLHIAERWSAKFMVFSKARKYLEGTPPGRARCPRFLSVMAQRDMGSTVR